MGIFKRLVASQHCLLVRLDPNRVFVCSNEQMLRDKLRFWSLRPSGGAEQRKKVETRPRSGAAHGRAAFFAWAGAHPKNPQISEQHRESGRFIDHRVADESINGSTP